MIGADIEEAIRKVRDLLADRRTTFVSEEDAADAEDLPLCDLCLLAHGWGVRLEDTWAEAFIAKSDLLERDLPTLFTMYRPSGGSVA